MKKLIIGVVIVMVLLLKVQTAENIPAFDSDQTALSLNSLLHRCKTVHGKQLEDCHVDYDANGNIICVGNCFNDVQLPTGTTCKRCFAEMAISCDVLPVNNQTIINNATALVGVCTQVPQAAGHCQCSYQGVTARTAVRIRCTCN